jgi:hypothetical protein
MFKDSIDAVQICHKLNENAMPHLYAHCAVAVFLLLGLDFVALLLNAPLLVSRLWLLKNRAYLLNPSVVTRMGAKGHAGAGGAGLLGGVFSSHAPPEARFVFALVVYALADVCYLYRLFSA